MVVTSRSPTSETEVMQERAACLLTITVHEPQRAWPQPNFVPVKPTSSRRNQSNGRSGSPSQLRSWPLIFTLIMIVPPSSYMSRHECLFEMSENIFPGRPLVWSQAKLTSLRNRSRHSKTDWLSVSGPIRFYFQVV